MTSMRLGMLQGHVVLGDDEARGARQSATHSSGDKFARGLPFLDFTLQIFEFYD